MFVLAGVAFLEILEAEIRSEEPRRTILQGDPAVAFQRRRPHPLIGWTIGLIDDEQRNPAHFGRSRKPDRRLALTVRSNPLEYPALLGGLPRRVERLKDALIALGFRGRSSLSLLDNPLRVIGR